MSQSVFIIVLITCWTVLSNHAYAQSDERSVPYVVAGVDCSEEEHVKALLDDAAITASPDNSLIIIARLGTRESSRTLIRGRLFVVSDYLTKNRGVSKARVITAEGERVRGLGHVEVYVGGKLFIIFKMKRNKHFGRDCPPP